MLFRTSHLHRLLSVAGALLVSACAHGPDARPSLPMPPAAFADQSALQASGRQPVALDEWWLGFEDPVLTELVRRALDQNLDLAISLARVDQARAVAAGAGARRLPQAALDARLLRQRQSLLSPEGELASGFPGYRRGQTLQSAGIGATWEADLSGGLRDGEAAAVAEWRAAEASRMGVRVTVAADVADAYFLVRCAQERIGIAEAHLKTRARFLGLVEDRLRVGSATPGDVAEARASWLQARLALPALEAEKARQLHRLDVLMGDQPGTFARARLADSPAMSVASQVPALPADMTPAELMRRRPDVIAAEHLLDASQARLGIATAEYYPHVTLSGVLGADSAQGALFGTRAFQPQALLGLHWRLFDFGRVDAEVDQARGARSQALVEVRARMLRATEDVENALVRLVQLEQQQDDLAAMVDAHQLARDAADSAYAGGVSSLFEPIEQERALLAARDQWAQLRADRARATVSAFRAFGGGWPLDPHSSHPRALAQKATP